ncbi:hypothetical protein AVEN_8560-1 [Araneus ventricosus]|uniref:Uncharacterized protein n=1 Tax=Araneus ventricosus TaxID=182803 RepID=A0A4Y2GMI8_ARAVE|nr:hypothetical protein AVEN_8560-1 [Araneus ventricosus]
MPRSFPASGALSPCASAASLATGATDLTSCLDSCLGPCCSEMGLLPGQNPRSCKATSSASSGSVGQNLDYCFGMVSYSPVQLRVSF